MPADHWSRTPPPIGTWVCFGHGPITPAATTPVRSCPHCGAIAYRVVADKAIGRTYAPDSPTTCPRGHQLGPGQVHLGRDSCRAHDGHHGWNCNTCGEWLYWPPRNERCATGIGMGPAGR